MDFCCGGVRRARNEQESAALEYRGIEVELLLTTTSITSLASLPVINSLGRLCWGHTNSFFFIITITSQYIIPTIVFP